MALKAVSKKQPLDVVPVKLDPAVVQRIKDEADARGMGYTVYTRDLIHQALSRDEATVIDELRRDILALERTVQHLSDTFMVGLAGILQTLASNVKPTAKDIENLMTALSAGKE